MVHNDLVVSPQEHIYSGNTPPESSHLSSPLQKVTQSSRDVVSRGKYAEESSPSSRLILPGNKGILRSFLESRVHKAHEIQV
jgi:hypothetical protein